MDVGQWMTAPVYTVHPLGSVEQVQKMMVRHLINQVPVVADGRLVGIVTDRDVRAASPSTFESTVEAIGVVSNASGGTMATNLSRIAVEEIMTPQVISVAPKESVEAAALLMRRERIGSLPVVENGRVVGIFTRSDVLDAFLALSKATRELRSGASSCQSAEQCGQSGRDLAAPIG